MLRTPVIFTLLFALLSCAGFCQAEPPRLLWQIGATDGSTAEFALAPADFEKFADDPLYAVGVSKAKQDWSYVQPGPADAWAGSRQHTFTIFFALKQKPKGACWLRIDLVDIQSQTPPEIAVALNGKTLVRQRKIAGTGGGDESIHGQLSKAKKQQIGVEIDSASLKEGTNEITITTCAGSWMLYDSIALLTPDEAELAPLTSANSVASIESPAVLVERGGKLCQPVRLIVRHVGKPTEATVAVTGVAPVTTTLKAGTQELEAAVPAVEKETPITVTLKSGGTTLAEKQLLLQPVRKMVVYLLPHSHVDIGYTQQQADVEKKQWQNIDAALDLIRKTADYPADSRFKWNAEVLWAIDSYLQKTSPEKQKRLIDAIQAGDVELDAMYGNELTALCRPEELLRLMQWGPSIGRRCGVTVDSAMISDVPGFTWGTIPALTEAGVKYFSIGPNYIDRMGRTMCTWVDKPFYWIAPDGNHKVLCWVPFMGYALGHTGYRLDKQLPERLAQLEKDGYPYDMVQLRWNVGGDNGHPDAGLSDLVKKWNADHAYPKMVITTTGKLFREFESRYGDKIPSFRGDFTPYWEDGASSTARETSLNRTAAERLVQAETLWSIRRPSPYPNDRFSAAWRNAILYDEHTWGAWNSITEPDAPFVLGQWKVKQAFAIDADAQSRELLDAASAGVAQTQKLAVDVFNTSCWPRTDLVVLSKEQSASVGDVVLDPSGKQLPSQRLTTGQLAFLAKDVPALAGRRYTITAGRPLVDGNAKAEGTTLRSPAAAIQLDETSGAIASLRSPTGDDNLCDMKSGVGLNRYYYVLGDKVNDAQQAGQPTISVKESGPLVASLLVESAAPGCQKFSREIRVVDGLDRVDIINVLDKTAVREKEGVHLGFAFNIPDGVIRMDIPWAVVRPEVDQLPGACKNWFTVGRWVDVSNDRCGVTWATLDAPMVEVGIMSGNLIGSINNPLAWRAKIEPTQTFYSWVMNNHWHTNYKADQSGPTTFRYALQPHKQYDPMAAQRFGIECSQPLVAVPASGESPNEQSLFQLDTADVLVASIKPSADGKAQIVRLFGAAGKPAKASLRWNDAAPKTVYLSNLAEDRIATTPSPIDIQPWEIVTLRVEPK